jgi:hypothetical protein
VAGVSRGGQASSRTSVARRLWAGVDRRFCGLLPHAGLARRWPPIGRDRRLTNRLGSRRRRTVERYRKRHLAGRGRLEQLQLRHLYRQLEFGHEALEFRHGRLEFGRLGQQRRLGGQQPLQGHLRVEERAEALGLQLQRAQQPVAQRRGQRRVDHRGRLLARARDQVLETLGVLVIPQPAPHDERQHGEAHLYDIAARRHDPPVVTGPRRHPQRSPQLFGLPVERVDGRAEHVVGEQQPRLWREQQMLGPERAAGRVAALRAEQRRRRQQLAQQQHHDADVEGEILRFRHVEQVGQAPPPHVVAHDAEATRAVGLHPVHPHVRRQATALQPAISW